jgi:transposase
MKQKSGPGKAPAEQVLKDIRRQTRRHYAAEEKIRIVLEGLRGEENISELCRREGIAASMYYGWSKEFLEAGKRRLAGDTARAATSGEVKDLRREANLSRRLARLEIANCLQPNDCNPLPMDKVHPPASRRPYAAKRSFRTSSKSC